MKFIKAQVIKYSIILLLKPEWLAKAETCFNIFENHRHIYTISQQLNTIDKREKKGRREYKLQVECFFNYKNNQNTNLVKKINSDATISSMIYFWLNNQNFIFEEYKYCENLILTNRFNNFFRVIYLTGLEWYTYTNLEIKQLYQNLYLANNNRQGQYLLKSQIISLFFISFVQYSCKQCINLREIKFCIFYPFNKENQIKGFYLQAKRKKTYFEWSSYRIIKNIFYIIRSNLYHKNKFGIWRVNSQLTNYKAKYLIKNVIYLLLTHYYYMINSLDKQFIGFTIDKILYLWQRKKDSR